MSDQTGVHLKVAWCHLEEKGQQTGQRLGEILRQGPQEGPGEHAGRRDHLHSVGPCYFLLEIFKFVEQQ